ncbi:MAG: hypothetical protein VYC82_05080 [Verrucomicrobiota bacterium]|nr:hypothetical protein [Verrucomicrobiota bacterium]
MRRILSLLVVLLVVSENSFRDVIVTESGSRIVGTFKGIDGGKITVATDFAGEIVIDQGQVDQMSTEGPVFISLESGAPCSGKIDGAPDGNLTVATDNGDSAVTVERVKERWMSGEQSPRRFEKPVNGPIKRQST